jgi:hypothetical protein
MGGEGCGGQASFAGNGQNSPARLNVIGFVFSPASILV